MPINLSNRVKEVASNKPTAGGAFTLTSNAAANMQNFSAFSSGTANIPCFAESSTAWMEFYGTYTTGSLAVNTLISSSTGSLIDWSGGGNVTVFVGAGAKDIQGIFSKHIAAVEGNGVATQSIAPYTFTKLSSVLSVASVNVSNFWNHTTKIFQPTITGYYRVTACFGLAAVPDQSSVIPTVYKKGTAARHLVRGFSSVVTGQNTYGSGSAIIFLNGSSDYIELYLYNDSASTLNVLNEAVRCWATFELVSI